MAGSRPRELDVIQLGQGEKESRFKLTSLVGGSLQTTETGHPASQKGVCHGVSCDVWDRDDIG
jgi:hypothetical protein